MDVRTLRYFAKTAETLNLTIAAEKLGVTQPALGQQIRQLEADLDVTLMQRHSRGIRLTDAGLALAEEAKIVLTAVENARARIQAFAEQPKGIVSIGLTPNTSSRFAAPLFRTITQNSPSISLSVVEEMSAILLDWVADNDLSLALAYGPITNVGVRCERLLEETLYFIHAPTESKPSQGEIFFDDVLKHSLVVPGQRHSTRSVFDQLAKEKNIEPKIIHEVQSVQVIKDLVKKGMGATILPFGSVEKEVIAGELIARRIIAPSLRRDLFLVQSDRRPLTRAEEAVKQMIIPLVNGEIAISDYWEK